MKTNDTEPQGKNKKLTVKQSLFVQKFLVDLNASQAAIRAGYSTRPAFRIGNECPPLMYYFSNLFSNPGIQEFFRYQFHTSIILAIDLQIKMGIVHTFSINLSTDE